MKALVRKIGMFLTRNSLAIGVGGGSLGATSFVVSLFIADPNVKDDLLILGLLSILTGVFFLYKTMKKQGGY